MQRKSWLDYFAIGLVNSVLARRVSEVLGGIQITEELLSILLHLNMFSGLVEMTLGSVHAIYSLPG